MIEQTVLVGLAAWRLASLFVNEDGPWAVFERVRRIAGVPADGEIDGVLPTLLTCMFCATVWTAAIMWAMWEFVSPWPVALAAAACIALAAERWNHGLHG
jgi:hypothetical protein